MINSLTIVTTLLSLTIVTNFSTQPLLKEQHLTIEKLTFCHLPFQVITIQLRTGMIHPKNEERESVVFEVIYDRIHLVMVGKSTVG